MLAAALPSVIATWALTGFYLSLGPTLAAQLLHSANLMWGGLAVFLLAGVGSISGVAAARTPPRAGMVGGCLILLAGAALTFAAITQSIPWLFLAGTAVAGLGFGAAWTGAYRMLTAAVAPADRAGLVDAIFIAAYLALSLPAVIAGLASQHYGLHDTALVYNAVIAALVAAAAAMTSLRRPPPRSGQSVSQPAWPGSQSSGGGADGAARTDGQGRG